MTSASEQIAAILAFVARAEKLKTELRHSWTTQRDRQESVAEHTWMCTLVAMTLFPRLHTPIDQLKVLKLIVVHDLAEAITGDIPYFESSERQTHKHELERRAMSAITEGLEADTRRELVGLWEEFEALETPEAKLARAIDKCEALFQHDLADVGTWDQGDYDVCFAKATDRFDVDRFVDQFKRAIDRETVRKMDAAGTTPRVDTQYFAALGPGSTDRKEEA